MCGDHIKEEYSVICGHHVTHMTMICRENESSNQTTIQFLYIFSYSSFWPVDLILGIFIDFNSTSKEKHSHFIRTYCYELWVRGFFLLVPSKHNTLSYSESVIVVLLRFQCMNSGVCISWERMVYILWNQRFILEWYLWCVKMPTSRRIK